MLDNVRADLEHARLINGLPPGTYTVTVWHEVPGLQTEQQVTVSAGKPTQANFNVKMEP